MLFILRVAFAIRIVFVGKSEAWQPLKFIFSSKGVGFSNSAALINNEDSIWIIVMRANSEEAMEQFRINNEALQDTIRIRVHKMNSS